MNFTKTCSTKTSLVQGIKVSIPVLLDDNDLDPCEAALTAAGLTPAVAAGMINQTFNENIVNNTSAEVKAMIAKLLAEEGGLPSWDGRLSSLDEEKKAFVYNNINVAEVQAAIDRNVKEYIPGARRTTSSAETLDPVDSKAIELARQAVLSKLSVTPFTWEGISYTGVGRTMKAASFKAFDALCKSRFEGRGAHEIIGAKAAELIEESEYFRKEAKRQLEEQSAQADSIALSI